MKNLSLVFSICLALFMTSCAGEGSAYSGISANAGPMTVSIFASSDGELVLSSDVSIQLIGYEYLGVSWVNGYQKTLIQAEKSKYHLYLLWEIDDEVIRYEYNIGQQFSINFERDDWVKKIQTDSNGNVIVFIEKQKISGNTIVLPLAYSPPTLTPQVDNCKEGIGIIDVNPYNPTLPINSDYAATLKFYNPTSCDFYSVEYTYGWANGLTGPEKIKVGNIMSGEYKNITITLGLPADVGTNYSITYNLVSNNCGSFSCQAITIYANTKKKEK
jgi:hypothetical protein